MRMPDISTRIAEMSWVFRSTFTMSVFDRVGSSPRFLFPSFLFSPVAMGPGTSTTSIDVASIAVVGVAGSTRVVMVRSTGVVMVRSTGVVGSVGVPAPIGVMGVVRPMAGPGLVGEVRSMGVPRLAGRWMGGVVRIRGGGGVMAVAGLTGITAIAVFGGGGGKPSLRAMLLCRGGLLGRSPAVAGSSCEVDGPG